MLIGLIEDLVLKSDVNVKCQEFLAIVPNNKVPEPNNVLFTFIIVLWVTLHHHCNMTTAV